MNKSYLDVGATFAALHYIFVYTGKEMNKFTSSVTYLPVRRFTRNCFLRLEHDQKLKND